MVNVRSWVQLVQVLIPNLVDYDQNRPLTYFKVHSTLLLNIINNKLNQMIKLDYHLINEFSSL